MANENTNPFWSGLPFQFALGGNPQMFPMPAPTLAQPQKPQQQPQQPMVFMSPYQMAAQPTTDPFAGLAALLHPATRHLGTSGNDITNQSGPYDSGGIDWLHAHRDNSAGRVAIDPEARAATQAAMRSAFAPPGQTVIPPLPFTVEAMRPLGPTPGFGSAAYPEHAARAFQQLQQLLRLAHP